jgi:hypothetical protein
MTGACALANDIDANHKMKTDNITQTRRNIPYATRLNKDSGIMFFYAVDRNY